MATPNPLLARLTLVEVEVHSRCNRKCWFCPNSFICRDGPAELLPEDVYLRLLADLADANWHGTLSFSRYNEPFAVDVFYRRLRQAHEALPDATLHTNTNGDYLTPHALAKAAAAGLATLCVQLYVPAGPWTAKASKARLAEISERLPGIRWKHHSAGVGRCEYRTSYQGLDMRARGRDFAATGTNRCGLDVTKPYTRTAACRVPSSGAFIDYSGHVMPCCNLRSDYPDHAAYSLGVLTAEAGSLAAILASPKATAWRTAGLTGPPPGKPCLACRFATRGGS